MLTLALVALAAARTPMANADRPEARPLDRSFVVISDTEIIADGHTFRSWQELADSGYFQHLDTRCATEELPPHDDPTVRGAPADCSTSNTNPAPAYSPSVSKLRIPVVVHVIQNTSGTGFVPESRIRSQIDILNEDFQALPGTNGALGFDTQIEFYLATEDPDGNPTQGFEYVTNTSWFNDSGNYWSTLAWNPSKYLNIYTNTASGALGYVPALPQEGIVGSTSDRVVVLYSSFGRNAPLSPFDLGRTATHEVGHYLGLYHTFTGGCASASNCSSNGDRICDTNPEASPTGGCPGSRTSCGLPAPFDNYMDYSDDRCMDRFTNDQGHRMRCTLFNYRSNLYSVENPVDPCSADLAPPIGELNFFDVQVFINYFAVQDPIADFDQNTVFNFFDIQAYVDAFYSCP